MLRNSNIRVVARFSKPLPGNSSLTYFGKSLSPPSAVNGGRLKYISLIFALSKECIFDREADRQFQTNRNGQLRGGSTSSPHPDVLTNKIKEAVFSVFHFLTSTKPIKQYCAVFINHLLFKSIPSIQIKFIEELRTSTKLKTVESTGKE